MTQAQIDRWTKELEELSARRDVMPDEIRSFTEAVGRKKRKGSPVYTYEGRPPLPVHVHPYPLKKIAKQKSLEILQGDLDMWEMQGFCPAFTDT